MIAAVSLCSPRLFLSRRQGSSSRRSSESSSSRGLHVNTPRSGLCFSHTHTHTLRWYPPSSHAMDILWQYQFRIILLGDSTVGKSSLLKRFTDGIYSDVADPTVGVDFYARSLDIEPGVKIKLQLWDTAGQERFRYETGNK